MLLTHSSKLPNKYHLSAAQALLAALLFGLNAPFAKMLLGTVPPMFMAAMLYLGAATGMAVLRLLQGGGVHLAEAKLTKQDGPWIAAMILLDIVAPFLLMSGLKLTTASNASLLMNFEMVATSMIALFFFREAIGGRMWLALALITTASIVLSLNFDLVSGFAMSPGSMMVLGACLCWGLENNCTSRLSAKDPALIVVVKGAGSGIGALAIAMAAEEIPDVGVLPLIGILALGFVSYGLSIFFYVRAQRGLGAARTSMYYAAAPFLGAGLSFLMLGESLGLQFVAATVLMVSGTILVVLERHSHSHIHPDLTHEHKHSHTDDHHQHSHELQGDSMQEHNHMHQHELFEHTHDHKPDIHHLHSHHKGDRSTH